MELNDYQKTQVLMIMELHFFIHVYKICNIYISKRKFTSLPLLLFMSVYDTDIGLASRYCVIVSMKWHSFHDLAFQVHFYNLVKISVVHVNGTFMDLMKSLFLIHLRDIFSGFLVNEHLSGSRQAVQDEEVENAPII